MKTHPTSIALLLAGLATLLATSLAAAPEPATARMYRVSAVKTAYGKGMIKPGTWRQDVIDSIGVPQKYLTPDVWLYRRFSANLEAADADGCHELVIAFADSRVSSLHLVNLRAEAVFVSRAARGVKSPDALLAAVEAPETPQIAGK